MELEYTKKEYEISIYRNELCNDYEQEFEDFNKIEYFKQNKIAVIGSNKYKSPIDACSPKFIININGKKTLTFNMYYQYFDYDKGDYELNPLISQIHNNTLVQLKLDGEYYDLLISKIVKNSDNSVYSYTADDAYITELGKNGFNAELAVELENNMGTINYLGEKILENCDWKVAPNDKKIEAPFYSDLIIQSLEDSLYKIQVENLQFEKRTDYLPDAYYIHEVIDYKNDEQKKMETITGTIYAFYNDIVDTEKDEIGFLFWNGNEETVVLNADGTVVNSYNYVSKSCEYIRGLVKTLSLMRGRRVVRSPEIFYDLNLKKVVNCFKNKLDPTDQTKYYGYKETDYMSPILTENYISNPYNMTSIYDWNYVNTGEKLDTQPRLLFQTMPRPTNVPYVSYLNMEPKREVLNKGIQGHRSNIKSFANEDKYIVAFLERTEGYEDIVEGEIESRDIESQDLNFSFMMAFYQYDDIQNNYVTTFSDIKAEQVGAIIPYTKFVKEGEFKISETRDSSKNKFYKYMEVELNLEENIPDLTKHLDNFLGMFIKNDSKKDQQIYEMMFFPKRLYNNEIIWPGRIIYEEEDGKFPGNKLKNTAALLCQPYYNIYKDDNGKSIIVDRTLNTSKYSIVYNENCEKISNLVGKEKNYYNLLSDLTKKFECWMEPRIERNNGEIVYNNYFYDSQGNSIEFIAKPEQITSKHVGKFFKDTDGKFKVIERQNIYEWIKIDKVYSDSSGISEVTEVTNECTSYFIEKNNIFYPTPVKTISYLENFEKFFEDGVLRTDITYSEIEDYSLNTIYLVDYIGVDTGAEIGHPIREWYELQLTTNYTLKEITKDQNFYILKKPSKWIIFKNYLNDTPNWAGFKYGINVKTIQRTEDSANFSTKVIVKNNSNEFAINGDKLCSIARAIDNPTRDNFIIDFGYYIRQGMLDKEYIYKDLYENYFPKIREINKQNEDIIEGHTQASIILDRLQSQYETYYLAYNAALENIQDYCKKVGNCGIKYAIEPDWNQWNIGGLCPIKDSTYIITAVTDESQINSTFSSEIFAGVGTNPGYVDYEEYEESHKCSLPGVNFGFEIDETMKWYDLKVIYYYDGKFYTYGDGIKREFNFTSTLGETTNHYYINVTDEDILNKWGLFTAYDAATKTKTPVVPFHVYTGSAKKMKPYYSKADYYWNRALYDYACRIDEDLIKKEMYGPIYRKAKEDLEEHKEKMIDNIKTSTNIINKKKSILNQFFSKYSDFLRESSWLKDDYVDDNLYYLDARDSLHAAAFPKISYTINVIDVDELEDYQVYKLKVGDYTFIEDTEYFGWDDKGRPAKEWVVITEATYDLEQPSNNSIKIQNYKTQIEDLFSKLSANIQQLELNKGGYNREITDRTWPIGTKADEKGIYSSNYNPNTQTGWALFNDGTWFLGEISKI